MDRREEQVGHRLRRGRGQRQQLGRAGDRLADVAVQRRVGAGDDPEVAEVLRPRPRHSEVRAIQPQPAPQVQRAEHAAEHHRLDDDPPRRRVGLRPRSPRPSRPARSGTSPAARRASRAPTTPARPPPAPRPPTTRCRGSSQPSRARRAPRSRAVLLAGVSWTARYATVPAMHPLTLGTAGHIDHGKTALVRALTGRRHRPAARGARARDLDRARLRAARRCRPGRRLSVVDVPGPRALRAHDGRGRDRHRPVPDGRRRRRRRDAADARARRGAGARSAWRAGVVAVTKADLADPARASAEAAELLPGAEVVPVCGAARRGARRAARGARPRRPPALPGRARRRRAAAARRPLVHDPRRRHRGHRHAVVGRARRAATRCASCPPGSPRARARRCRSTTSRSSARRPASGSR